MSLAETWDRLERDVLHPTPAQVAALVLDARQSAIRAAFDRRSRLAWDAREKAIEDANAAHAAEIEAARVDRDAALARLSEVPACPEPAAVATPPAVGGSR